MRLFLILVLLVPQFAAAGVFMCVDPQTGKKTFTDKGCEETVVTEQLRVGPTNTASGAKTSRGGSAGKAWNSQRDETRTGREYREEERVGSGTASVSSDGGEYYGSGY